MQFLLLNGSDDSDLKLSLAEALAPLGSLIAARAGYGLPPGAEEPDGPIIIDATMVADVETLVSQLRSEKPERKIVVMTASPTWQRARAAFEAGAMDYLPKTLQPDQVLIAFEHILRRPLPPWPR